MNDLKQQWAEIPEWQKFVLIFAAGFFILYGIYFMLIQPKKENIRKLSQEVDTLERQVNTLKRYTSPAYIKRLENEISSIQKEIAQLKDELKDVEKIIPTDKNLDQILSYISFSANRSKLVLEKFKVSDEKTVWVSYNEKTKNLKFKKHKTEQQTETKQSKPITKEVRMKQINIDILLKGDVKKLKNFLVGLSKSERYIAVDNIHLVKGEESLSSEIKLKTLYLPEE